MASRRPRNRRPAITNRRTKSVAIQRRKPAVVARKKNIVVPQGTPGRTARRFPTESELLISGLGGDPSRIYQSIDNKARAERWMVNYRKSLGKLIERLGESPLADEEVLDDLDELYWDMANWDVITFVTGQMIYPEELSITEAYRVEQQELNAMRIVERWSDIRALSNV